MTEYFIVPFLILLGVGLAAIILMIIGWIAMTIATWVLTKLDM